MELNEILELLGQGISDEELNNLITQWREKNPDVTREEFNEAAQQAMLSGEQRFQLQTVTEGNEALGLAAKGNVLDDTAALALGAGIPGATAKILGGTAGKGAVITGVNEAGQVITKLANQGILDKIARTMIKTVVPAALRGGRPFTVRNVAGGVAGRVGLGVGAAALAVGNTGPQSAAADRAAGRVGAPGGLPVPQGAPGVVTGARARQLQGSLGAPGQQALAPQDVPTGFNVLVIDHSGQLTGTPGAVSVISPLDLGMVGTAGEVTTDTAAVQAAIAGQPNGSVDWTNFLQNSLQETPAGLASQDLRVFQTMFPEGIGDIRISAPTVVNSRSSLAGAPSDNPALLRPPPIPGMPGAAGRGVQEERLPVPIGAPRAVTQGPNAAEPVEIPGGAELSSRALSTFGSRTLIEWADISARKFNVPLNLLYGLVAHESGWNPNAVGDNGQSHGLAQIYQPVWGDSVTPGMSRNPIFALNWAAQKLRERFNQYGSWEVAVAAHNSPVAADYLARNGTYQNKKSASYVQDILNRANRSGLADSLFNDAGENFTYDEGGSGSGISISPFEAPDPAKSRAYVRSIYQQMLGRNPTDDEFTKEVKRLNDLAKQSYDQQVRNALGRSSTEVDVGSRFEEGIREMGEFGFHEDVQEYRSFVDHVAGFARLLQQGL